MLIAFEGIDGAGKATQAARFAQRFSDWDHERMTRMDREQSATRKHVDAVLLSFPQYDKTLMGMQIKKYLRGEFGGIKDNNPFLVALMFAVDRAEALPQMRDFVNNFRTILVCDRYVHSNIAHQCGKIYAPDCSRWRRLAADIENVEFGSLKLPKPDLVFYLDLTAEQSYSRTHRRDTDSDIHQDNKGYLAAVRDVYLDYTRTYQACHPIPCFNGTKERTVEEIHNQIWTEFSEWYQTQE